MSHFFSGKLRAARSEAGWVTANRHDNGRGNMIRSSQNADQCDVYHTAMPVGRPYSRAEPDGDFAEVFQATRRIDRVYQAPWLVVFKTVAVLHLLDLTGEFATRMGASMAIHSGSRPRARGWARDLYAAFPLAQGIVYASSMHAGAPALALNERALRKRLFPPNPEFHRALADDVLLDPLKHAAQALGYALQ